MKYLWNTYEIPKAMKQAMKLQPMKISYAYEILENLWTF